MDATANGKFSVRDELREVRLKSRLIQERLKLRTLERGQKLRENQDSWDYLNTYQDLLDRLRQPDGVLLTPISTANDRRYGAMWPFWRTWTDHAKLRGISRMMVGLSHQAEGALAGLCSYIIGEGIVYRAVTRHDAETPPELIAVVQDLIDEFVERNSWELLEQEIFTRTHRDGEAFVRYFQEEDGCTIVRTVEPEYVCEHIGEHATANPLDEWSFGIHNEPGDVQSPIGYWVSYTGSGFDGEEVPAGEMQHLKIGVDRNVKRGKPDFIFDTYDHLKSANRALGNMAEGAAVQAAIALVREHEVASSGAVQSFVDGLADYQRPNPFNGQMQDVQRIQQGTVLDIPRGMKYVDPPSAGAGAQYWQQMIQMTLRNVGTKWNAPEWLISGDASNNNFASSVTAESPFVKTCKRQQSFYGSYFLKTIWQAIKGYVDHFEGLHVAGRVYSWREVRRLVDVQAEPPTIEVRNRVEQAQENSIYVQMGAKSIQTVSQELGMDYDQEQINREEFQERTGGVGAGLPLPTDDQGNPKPLGLSLPKLSASNS